MTHQPTTRAALTKGPELVAQPTKHSKGETMKHLQYLVMVGLLLLLAACGQTQAPEAAPTEEVPPVEEAAPTETTLQPTAAHADIVGTVRVTNSNVSAIGLDVYLHYWNGRQWVNLGKQGVVDRYSRITMRGWPTGYYYNIRVSDQVQSRDCTVDYQGDSDYFLHRYTRNWSIPVKIYKMGTCPLF